MCAVPFTTRIFVPCLFDSVEAEVSNIVQRLAAIFQCYSTFCPTLPEVCNQWTGLDWTGLTFVQIAFMTLKHATITCLVVYCVVATLRKLCSHVPNPQSAGGGVAGLSTLFADWTVVIPSTRGVTHLSDFVAKANTAVHSMYTPNASGQSSKVQYYMISTRSVVPPMHLCSMCRHFWTLTSGNC